MLRRTTSYTLLKGYGLVLCMFFLLTSNKHLAYSYLVIVIVRITLRKWKLSWVSVWLDVVVVVVVAFWCALLHTSIPIQLHKHLLITGNLISLRVIATWCTRRIMFHRSSVCSLSSYAFCLSVYQQKAMTMAADFHSIFGRKQWTDRSRFGSRCGKGYKNFSPTHHATYHAVKEFGTYILKRTMAKQGAWPDRY